MSTKNNVTAKISKSGKLLVSKNVKVEKISPELLPESLLNSVGLESVQDHELSNILLGATAEFEFMPEVVEAEKVLNTINIQDQQDVLNSKRYIKGIMNFSAPSEILKPCIDFLASTGGSLRLSGEKEQNNANTDGTINISYGRLNLVTSFDIDETLKYEVGILIAYDLGVPKIKIYRGAKVSACLNLCIFSAEDIVKFDIGEGVNMESVQHFLADVVLKISKVREVVERLRGILIAPQNVSQIVGSMMLETVEKNLLSGTNSILRAVDLFSDDKSKYYYKQQGFNAWQLYNAFTEYYQEKVNFFDIPEKTRDTFQLIEKYCLAV